MTYSFIEILKEKAWRRDQALLASKNLPIPDMKDYFLGYSADEIETIIRWQRVTNLPSLYRSYLLTMGHYNGVVLSSLSRIIDFQHHKTIKQNFTSYLSNQKDCSNNYIPPENIFIIANDVEDFFFFISKPQEVNPIVYYYNSCFIKHIATENLSSWLMNHIFINPIIWVKENLQSQIQEVLEHLDDNNNQTYPPF